MRLTDEQVKALVAWADEGDRPGGTTAWGPKFSAVMEVAQHVRDNGHRCNGCNDILGVKFRQDVPKQGDLCPTCYEKWFNADLCDGCGAIIGDDFHRNATVRGGLRSDLCNPCHDKINDGSDGG